MNDDPDNLENEISFEVAQAEWKLALNAPLDTKVALHLKAHTVSLLTQAARTQKISIDKLAERILSGWLYGEGY